MRNKLFSVTIKDCRVDTFTVGGHGGSGKDTSNTGVRITHPDSGAVGRCVDTRSQAKNKALAFKRMGQSKAFQVCAKLQASKLSGPKSIDQQVEESLTPSNLRVEGINFKGIWVPFDES